MGVRPIEHQLDPETRTALEARLLESGFADYNTLTAWLQERGYEFSRATVARFGKRFEERCDLLRLANQQAQHMRQHFADDEAALADAALQLAQSTIFKIMLERGEELTPKELGTITRALTDSARGTVAVKKYQANLKTQIEEKLKALEGENHPLSQGIDPRTLKRVREEIYGLF